MVVVSHSQNNNNQFLSVVTVLVLPTDEIERPGSIKTELRVTVVQLLDGVRFVAIFVIRFVVHHQHRVRPFLIIENENIVDLEPVFPRPLVILLGGIQYPLNVEFIGLGGA